jgi:hypothetical protein
MPRNILVFDTETEHSDSGGIEYHRAKMAWSVFASLDSDCNVTSETWTFFTQRWKLCEYIENMAQWKGELLLCGNNIYFDLQACLFFQYFTEKKWTMTFCYDKGTTYILVIAKCKTVIRIISLTNFLEASVKALGEMIHYQKIEIDLATADDDLTSIYCFRDTEITLEAFLNYIRFLHTNDLGKFSLSRASQSMQAFRHRFMTHKLFHHYDPLVMPLEESAYFGGRTEMFYIGKCYGGPFIDLDINSMYPYIMRTFPMPTKCIDYQTSLIPSDLTDLAKNYGLIADVTIDTDEPIYPYRLSPKMLFPTGRFRTTLCTQSLVIALKRGHVRHVHSASIYEMSAPFVSYVDFFYALRNDAKKRGDDITQRMAKLFMNSLYGKFAQKRPIVKSDIEISFDGYIRETILDIDTGQYETVTKMLNREVITYGDEVMKKSILAIPAHVTDYGRCMLYEIIESLGREKVLYCDTDSIKIRRSDLAFVTHPISDSALGHLKIESSYNKLTLFGLKDYETDKTTKLKGVPKRAIHNKDGSYSYKQFLRQSSHLRVGNQTTYMIRDVVKRLRRVYTKGKVNRDGTISPWVFPVDIEAASKLR